MRKQVQRFAEEMEKVLAIHDNFKGGYQSCTNGYLYRRLMEESAELFQAIFEKDAMRGGKNVVRECVDVANFAMMIADKYLKHNKD